MLPTFRQHAGRYGFGLCLGVSFLCLLMAFALLRNSQALGLLEVLPAGFAIAFGVTRAPPVMRRVTGSTRHVRSSSWSCRASCSNCSSCASAR